MGLLMNTIGPDADGQIASCFKRDPRAIGSSPSGSDVVKSLLPFHGWVDWTDYYEKDVGFWELVHTMFGTDENGNDIVVDSEAFFWATVAEMDGCGCYKDVFAKTPAKGFAWKNC